MSETELRACLTPLVSSLRYHFFALDAYPDRLRGYARPAPTLEEAVRQVVGELQTSPAPAQAMRDRAALLNQQTRTMFDMVIAGHENDAALGLNRIGAETAQSPHGTLRQRFEAIDRAYRRRPLGEDPDPWFDYFDAQIHHIDMVTELEHDIAAVLHQPNPVSLGLHGRGMIGYALLAASLAAAIATGLFYVVKREMQGEAGQEPAAVARSDDSTRVVRTVPIDLRNVGRSASDCSRLEMEIAEPGIALTDRIEGGAELIRLPPGERVVVRRVQDLPDGGRFIEVEARERGLAGYIPEKAARLPVMDWMCDR